MSKQAMYVIGNGGSRVSRYARGGFAVVALAMFVALGCVTPALADFGITSFDGGARNQDGSTDTQAGSHPYEFTTAFAFTNTGVLVGNAGPSPDGNVKDVSVALPAGLVGNPAGLPQCPQEKLVDLSGGIASDCPDASQVGQITLHTTSGDFGFAVYNMVAPAGEPAQFGAFIAVAPVYIDFHVRSGGDYGLSASLSDVSTLLPFTGSALTLWGVPADPSHDPQRGATCIGDPSDLGNCFGGGQSAGGSLKPFLTLPGSCVGPRATALTADSWQAPGDFKSASFLSHDETGHPIGVDGCNRLDFNAVDHRPAGCLGS